jgi:hypothetical protein
VLSYSLVRLQLAQVCSCSADVALQNEPSKKLFDKRAHCPLPVTLCRVHPAGSTLVSINGLGAGATMSAAAGSVDSSGNFHAARQYSGTRQGYVFQMVRTQPAAHLPLTCTPTPTPTRTHASRVGLLTCARSPDHPLTHSCVRWVTARTVHMHESHRTHLDKYTPS